MSERAPISLPEQAIQIADLYEKQTRQFLVDFPTDLFEYWHSSLKEFDQMRTAHLRLYGTDQERNDYLESVDHRLAIQFSTLARRREAVSTNPQGIYLTEIEVQAMDEIPAKIAKFAEPGERDEGDDKMMVDRLERIFKRKQKSELRKEKKGWKGTLGRIFPL